MQRSRTSKLYLTRISQTINYASVDKKNEHVAALKFNNVISGRDKTHKLNKTQQMVLMRWM